MKRYFFHAFVCLSFIVMFILLGLSLCAIPSLPIVSSFLITKLQENNHFFFDIGVCVLGVGFFLLILFYFLNRQSFYHVELESSLSFDVHRRAIKKGISDTLKQEIPHCKVPFILNIYGRNVEVIADMTKISLEQHEEILNRLEGKLGQLFEKNYGAPEKFTISVAASNL